MTDYWHDAKAHLSKKDKVLKKIIASYEGEILVKKGDAFLTLARAITGQQISVKAADTVWARFSQAVGKVAPKNVQLTKITQHNFFTQRYATGTTGMIPCRCFR
jgi:DNA-3-methyladenine glycosylase II